MAGLLWEEHSEWEANCPTAGLLLSEHVHAQSYEKATSSHVLSLVFMSTLLCWHWTSPSATFPNVVLDDPRNCLHKDDNEQFLFTYLIYPPRGEGVPCRGLPIRPTLYWQGLLGPTVCASRISCSHALKLLALWAMSTTDETRAWLPSYWTQLEGLENWADTSIFEIWGTE